LYSAPKKKKERGERGKKEERASGISIFPILLGVAVDAEEKPPPRDRGRRGKRGGGQDYHLILLFLRNG